MKAVVCNECRLIHMKTTCPRCKQKKEGGFYGFNLFRFQWWYQAWKSEG